MAPSEFPGAALPPGLPDVATLARLAGEFFAALPGQSSGAAARVPAAGGVPVPTPPQPAGLTLPPGLIGPATPSTQVPSGPPPGFNLVPTSPNHLADAGANSPKLLPHAQAPNGLPENLLVAAPAYDGRLGGRMPDYRLDMCRGRADAFRTSLRECEASYRAALESLCERSTVEDIVRSRFSRDHAVLAEFDALIGRTALI